MSFKLRPVIILSLLIALVLFPVASSVSSARWMPQSSGQSLLGLQQDVEVIRDRFGIPHIYAANDADAYFMLGYVHAQDRLFQMDVNRRTASGTLGELLGPGPNNQVLGSDVQFRTIGLRRAAERSLAAYSPEAIAVLQAYANGVNSYLDSKPLPPEYTALEITVAGIPRWTMTDSLTILKLISFGLSFDGTELTDTNTLAAFRAAGQVGGFDGTRLFAEDLFRSAPFERITTIAAQQSAVAKAKLPTPLVKTLEHSDEFLAPQTLTAIDDLQKQLPDGPIFNQPTANRGSNWYVVSGARTATGSPMLANDPHLPLTSPSTFYEAHIVVQQSDLNVFGVTFPGIPGFPQGFNDRIVWGSTVNPLDVTDFYQERIITDAAGRFVATQFRGAAEPLVPIPETYKVNVIGDQISNDTSVVTSGVPPATLIVPRRNNGALITQPSGPPNGLTALSFQWAGSSPTRELDALLIFSRARNLDDFKHGLQFFDVGSQNWSYMDRDGNIAYFSSGEVPLREDLQANTVDGGIPPYIVRDGTGTLRHEWIVNNNPPPDQALRYAILPFDEMPQTVNPAAGFLVSANNDPVGTTLDNNPVNQLRRGGQGIYYLAPNYVMGGRAARIDRLIHEKLDAGKKLTFQDMQRIQSDTLMRDAQVLTPSILQAFTAARRSGAPASLAAFASDPAVSEAVGRLGGWDFTTPTGIEAGFDTISYDGPVIGKAEKRSVAATLYSVWRGQLIKNTIDATLARLGLGNIAPPGEQCMIALRNLLDNFATNRGRGASGVNFFDVPNVSLAPEAERDIILLQSLKDALNLLASPAFAPAFAQSTDQKDYRWGKLHRIVFSHTLNLPVLNIPSGAPGFTNLAPDLPGLATDGGFDTVDAATHPARAATLNGFMFNGGPSRRFVGEARPGKIRAVENIPGGESGIPFTPFFGNLLRTWLVNVYHDALTTDDKVNKNGVFRQVFEPAK